MDLQQQLSHTFKQLRPITAYDYRQHSDTVPNHDRQWASLPVLAMKRNHMPAFLLRRSMLVVAALCTLLPLAPAQSTSKPPATLPSESPTVFVPTNSGFDYDRREVMVPMRDGVKLHTVILVPKGTKNAPILL